MTRNEAERVLRLLSREGCTVPEAVHRYHCPDTRIGRCNGPCDCGAEALQKELDECRLWLLSKGARALVSGIPSDDAIDRAFSRYRSSGE